MPLTTDKRPLGRARYDWYPFREACMQQPGQWIKEDDPDRPKTTGHQIRNGSPALFLAGAFDAVYRKDGTYVCYLGVPVEPWQPWAETRFEDLERTYDPDRFPEETPTEFVDAAEANTPEKTIKRERKRRAKKEEKDNA